MGKIENAAVRADRHQASSAQVQLYVLHNISAVMTPCVSPSKDGQLVQCSAAVQQCSSTAVYDDNSSDDTRPYTAVPATGAQHTLFVRALLYVTAAVPC